MAGCIVNKSMFGDVKIGKVNPKKQTNGKPMSFDVTKMSNEMVYQLFFGDKRAVLKNIKKIIKNPKIYKKIVDDLNLSGSRNILTRGLEETDDVAEQKKIGNVLKFRAVALKEVLGAISSEADVNDNIGITDSTLQNSMINADGSRNINIAAVSQSIGKILMTQNGITLLGTAPEVNFTYGNIGMVALEELASDEVNIIDIHENGTILNPDFKNEELESVSKKRGSKSLILNGFPVASINPEQLMSAAEARVKSNIKDMNSAMDKGDLNSVYEFSIAEETISSANAISRLITPSNVQAPMTSDDSTMDQNDPKIKDLGDGNSNSPGIKEEHFNILKTMQGRKQKINPAMNTFMMGLHKAYLSLNDLDEADPDATLKRIYEEVGITEPAIQHKIFGAFVGSTSDNFESEIGRSISKENPLLQLIMYYNNLVDKNGDSVNFHQRLGVYRTTRIEMLNTFLNEQTDKNFSRVMIQGEPLTVDTTTELGKKLFNKIVNSILDETNLTVEQVTDEKFDPELEKLIKGYKDIFIDGNNIEEQSMFMNEIASNKIGRNMRNAVAPGFTGNVFLTLSVLHALSDIREAKKTGNKLKTAYRTKPDASTSGVTLTFAQNIGKDVTKGSPEDKVLDMFRRLGYTTDMIGKDPELADSYHILLSEVKKASERKFFAGTKTQGVMNDLARLKIFNSVRDLAKPMTMVTNYQAGDVTAVVSTSQDLTESVTDYLMSGNTTVDGVNYVKDMIKSTEEGKKFYDKNNIGSMKSWEIANLEGVNEHITNFFIDNLSTNLRTYIKAALKGPTGNYKNRLSTRYSKLKAVFMEDARDSSKSSSEKVTLGAIPAMTWMYLSNSEKEQYNEVYEKIQQLDDKKITQKEFNDYFEKFAEFQRDMLSKYKAPMTSRKQIMSKVKGKNVIYNKEVPNGLTPAVNLIHGIDVAIYFKSHIDTVNAIKEIVRTGKYKGNVLTRQERRAFAKSLENASGMIHDQNNADPYYNEIYEDFYRTNSVLVSSEYDIEEQLALTYASYYNKNGKGKNGVYDHTEAIDMLRKSKELLEKKKKALKNIDETSERFFGFSNELPKPDPKKTRPTPTSKTKNRSQNGDRELSSDFLQTNQGKKEIAASEEENGEYDKFEHTHKKDSEPRIMRTKDDKSSTVDTKTWEESEEIMDTEAKRLDELVASGQKYWMVDLENTWSSVANPLDDRNILEFYGEEYQNGVPTGKKISHKFLPKFPIQYDSSVAGTDYQNYDYFRESKDLSRHVGSKGSSKFFTEEGYQKFMKDIADELFEDGDSQNLVAYNGLNADFPLIMEQFGSILDGKTINGFDAMMLNYSQNKELDVKNSNRKLSDQHKNIPSSERTNIDEDLEHTGAADIAMMNDLMMYDLRNRRNGDTTEDSNADEENRQEEIRTLKKIKGYHLNFLNKAESDLKEMNKIFNNSSSDLSKEDMSQAKDEIKDTEKMIENIKDEIEKYDKKINDLSNERPIESNDGTEIVTNRRGDQETRSAVDDAVKADKTGVLKAFFDKYGYGMLDVGDYSAYLDREDVVQITNNADLTVEELMTQLLHEISHQKSVGFIGANPEDPDVKFLSDNLDRIKEFSSDVLSSIENPSVRSRIYHKIINESNDTRALIELVAMINAEPEVRDALKSAFDNPVISARINRLIRKIINYFKNRSSEIDMDKVISSVNKTVEKGEIFNDNSSSDALLGRQNIRRKLNSDAEIGYSGIVHNDARRELLDANSYRKIKRNNDDDTFIEGKWRSANRITGLYANQLLYNMLSPTSEYFAVGAHKYLKRKSKVYKRTSNAIRGHWMGADWLQSFKGYIDRSRVGDLYALNLMEKMQMEASQDVDDFERKTIVEIKDIIKKSSRLDENGNFATDSKGKNIPLTEEDISNITNTVARAPIFHLMNVRGDWKSILNSSDPDTKIQEMIDNLESKFKGKSDFLIEDAKAIANVLTKNSMATTKNAYNVAQMNISDEVTKKQVQELVALYSLRMTKDVAHTIKTLKANPKLADKLGELSKSLKIITDQVISNTADEQAFRENIIYEQFSKPKEFKSFSENTNISSDLPYSEGWRIIRHPSKKGYGLAYRDRDKRTIQPGAGISADFKYYDVKVNDEIKKSNADTVGAVKVTNGTNSPYHKVVLTQQELDTVGDLITDPAEILAKAYSQMMLVKGTATARNFILYGDKIKNIELQKDIKKFNKKLEKMDVELRPWFLKIPDNTNMDKFFKDNPNIKIFYKMPDENQLSGIDDFNSNITLVRKDMNDMVAGYKDVSFFERNDTLNSLMYVLRQAVVKVKQTWIMLSPKKIAADIASNQVILAAYGVPVKSMVKDQLSAIRLSKSMSNLRSSLLRTEFEIRGTEDPKKKAVLEAKRNSIVKKIEKHPMAPIYQNGMVQSLSTDILLKDKSVVSGLQKDIEDMFNFILKTKAGNPTNIAKGIEIFQRTGISIDDIAKIAGKNIKQLKLLGELGKNFGGALEESADRVRKKKEDKDIAKYLSEFIGSPDSEILRFGSYLTNMADVSSRYALYNHLKRNATKIDNSAEKGYSTMGEEEIVRVVLEAFVDYKVNMPRELKFVSDHGFLLFPSFWLRIQKIIYAIAKDNPLKVAAGITLEELLNIHVESYVDSNIFSKVGNIVNLPPLFTDPEDVIIPTKLIEFLSLGAIKL